MFCHASSWQYCPDKLFRKSLGTPELGDLVCLTNVLSSLDSLVHLLLFPGGWGFRATNQLRGGAISIIDMQAHDEEAQTSVARTASGSFAYPKLKHIPSGHREERDQSALGLALYALSSCFLSTALVFAKKLGVWS